RTSRSKISFAGKSESWNPRPSNPASRRTPPARPYLNQISSQPCGPSMTALLRTLRDEERREQVEMP
ncbi:MAG: hypothetical protein WBR14_21290, partial [Candidatus Acidiferrum sp.]